MKTWWACPLPPCGGSLGRGVTTLCTAALVLGLSSGAILAAEVDGTLVGCLSCCQNYTSRSPQISRSACCDPSCANYGPIRRFFRRIFHPNRPECCPRGTVVAVPVVPACPAPACPPSAPAFGAPATFVPAPPAAIGAPATPLPPSPATTPFPSAGSSRRPNYDDPPSSIRPVRLDLLAHRERESSTVIRAKIDDLAGVDVLLVNADRPGQRHRLRSDDQSRISANVPAGEWLIYTLNGNEPIFRGSVQSQPGKGVDVRLSDRQ